MKYANLFWGHQHKSAFSHGVTISSELRDRETPTVGKWKKNWVCFENLLSWHLPRRFNCSHSNMTPSYVHHHLYCHLRRHHLTNWNILQSLLKAPTFTFQNSNFDMVNDDEWCNEDECLGIQPSQVMVITRPRHTGLGPRRTWWAIDIHLICLTCEGAATGRRKGR